MANEAVRPAHRAARNYILLVDSWVSNTRGNRVLMVLALIQAPPWRWMMCEVAFTEHLFVLSPVLDESRKTSKTKRILKGARVSRQFPRQDRSACHGTILALSKQFQVTRSTTVSQYMRVPYENSR